MLIFSMDVFQSTCGLFHLYSNGSVCSRLNNFIQTFKSCFLFISLVSYDKYFVSNVVIVINSCGVLLNYIFLNLQLFLLTYVSPMFYMIDWEYHVSLKTELARNFCLIRWYMFFTDKSAAARMPIHGTA